MSRAAPVALCRRRSWRPLDGPTARRPIPQGAVSTKDAFLSPGCRPPRAVSRAGLGAPSPFNRPDCSIFGCVQFAGPFDFPDCSISWIVRSTGPFDSPDRRIPQAARTSNVPGSLVVENLAAPGVRALRQRVGTAGSAGGPRRRRSRPFRPWAGRRSSCGGRRGSSSAPGCRGARSTGGARRRR